MMDYAKVLGLLAGAKVEFVLIGGAAAMVHGSARLTQDIDVVYRRSRENITRLVESLKNHRPYLRGAPPGLPFQWDEETVHNGLNFTLELDIGYLDLLGEAAGGGTYEALAAASSEVEAFGVRFRCVTLAKLIHLKRAAGRPKDFEAIAELELLADEKA